MLYVLSSFISLNALSPLTQGNWSVRSLVTLLIAVMLGFFLYLKIAFNIGCDISLVKGPLWTLGSKIGVQKFCIFSISCKGFITFYECNYFWRFCLIRKPMLNSFSKLFYYPQYLSRYNYYLLTNSIHMENLWRYC